MLNEVRYGEHFFKSINIGESSRASKLASETCAVRSRYLNPTPPLLRAIRTYNTELQSLTMTLRDIIEIVNPQQTLIR